MKISEIVGLLIFCMLSFNSVAVADENQTGALKGQVDELSKKIANLENKLNQVSYDVKKPASSSVENAYVAPVSTKGGLIHTMQDLNMGGYVETQWNNNFHQPRVTAAAPAQNRYRAFDEYTDSFVVNEANLWLEKPVSEAGDVGFRTELGFGTDARFINGDTDSNQVDLQQAYIQYIAPLGLFSDNEYLPHSVKILAGRFYTLAGFEVIPGPFNWNISRSFEATLAVPFTHTGLRSNFKVIKDFFDVYLGINNGWDVGIDNNKTKTLESGLVYAPIKNVTVMHTFYWGGEVSGTPGGKRWLLTNNVKWDATEKLAFVGFGDYGAQHHVQDPNTVNPQTNDADWWSLGGYARYQLTQKLAMCYRAELFADDASYRTGIVGTLAGAQPEDRLFEQTITAEYKVTDNLLTRAEFRHDKAHEGSPFQGDHSAQSTLGAQVVYLI